MSAGSQQNDSPAAYAGPVASQPPVATSAPVAAAIPPGLLEMVLGTPSRGEGVQPSPLERFLQAATPGEALGAWLRWTGAPLPPDPARAKDQLGGVLARAVAQIDSLLSAQVQAILHHREFQRLEAAWRGLRYLVDQVEPGTNVKIRVLDVSRKDLARDLERAIEFDQSQIFRKVYENEFGMPGGEPFGVLIGDYELANHPDDVGLLEQMAGVAAAAFAPFVAAASPSLLGLESFAQLERGMDLGRVFGQLEHLKWRALRDQEDARFVGLVLPRFLARLPYEDDGSRVDGFCFREDVAAFDHSRYVWANAAYAFAAVLVRSFARTGWLAEINGVHRDLEAGGLVTGLPVHSFSTDKRGVAPKCSTEVMVTDQQEQDLGDLGFIPLCACKGTEYSAFYGSHSIQKPKVYDDPAATTNARISAMLKYMLCVSRFAHYLKVIARDRVGSFAEAADCEEYLHRWLQRYVTADPEASPAVKAELPLREARVQVVPHPQKPGSYLCTAHLWPHYELDELAATVRLATELSPGQPA